MNSLGNDFGGAWRTTFGELTLESRGGKTFGTYGEHGKLAGIRKSDTLSFDYELVNFSLWERPWPR